MLRSLLPILLAASFLPGLLACQIQNPNQQSETTERPASVDADGWTTLVIQGGVKSLYGWYAAGKAEIDAFAHFHSSSNACLKEESGAFELEPWNRFASALNRAIQSPPLRDENCLPSQEFKRAPDTIEVQLVTGAKRKIFDGRAGQLCTWISDPSAARELMHAIDEMLIHIGKENCPSAPST